MNKPKDISNTEKIKQGTGDPIEVYTSEICFYLDEYKEQGEIDDLRSISQSRWNSALYYIYLRTFKDTNKLKARPYIDYSNDQGRQNLIHSNLNAYDLEQVGAVLEVYENLCFEYEKEVSIFGFSRLTGITRETLYSWANDEKLCSGSSDIYKNLTECREETLSDKLFSNKGNPVGTLGILNRWYGWNMGQPRTTGEQKTQSIEDIQKKYRSLPGGEQEPGSQDTQ